MKKSLHCVLVLAMLVCCSCVKPPDSPPISGDGDQSSNDDQIHAPDPPDTLVTEGYDQQEMQAAIARARSEVDAFLVAFNEGNGSDFSVKAPIEDDGETEHFWLTDVVYRDGKFEGLIGNDPGIVTNVEFGDKWTIGKEEISDWMFMRDGKMHGNYTLRPLLKTMPAEQAEQLRSLLAEP